MTRSDTQIGNAVGLRIRNLRVRNNWSQNELAERLRHLSNTTNSATVSRWEAGGSEPSAMNLVALATVFGVSIDSLMGYVPVGSQPVTTDITPLMQTYLDNPKGFFANWKVLERFERLSLLDKQIVTTVVNRLSGGGHLMYGVQNLYGEWLCDSRGWIRRFDSRDEADSAICSMEPDDQDLWHVEEIFD